mmetsp:Transcript_94139/g.269570  ORF Transcript_94139/g.269570 Transcript_94139/m.269570 type:complete len:181 (+) Transcript_94139:299-841(+)
MKEAAMDTESLAMVSGQEDLEELNIERIHWPKLVDLITQLRTVSRLRDRLEVEYPGLIQSKQAGREAFQLLFQPLRVDVFVKDKEAALDTPSESQSPNESREPPINLVCPISQELYVDPVSAEDGCVYERKEIEAWFSRGNRTSPLTNVELTSTELKQSKRVKARVEQWREEEKWRDRAT